MPQNGLRGQSSSRAAHPDPLMLGLRPPPMLIHLRGPRFGSGFGEDSWVMAEASSILGLRRACPGPTWSPCSQGGLPGGSAPHGLARRGREVSCVSVKPPGQTQSCKEHRAGAGGTEGTSTDSAPPPSLGLQLSPVPEGLQGCNEAACVAQQPPRRPQRYR